MFNWKHSGLIIISGGFGGLTAVACLSFMLPVANATPLPSQPVALTVIDGKERKLQIERGDDLSFKVPVALNGQPITMLVDTGANVTVLTRADAAKVGIPTGENAGNLDVLGLSSTKVRLRHIGARSMQLGPISLEGVPLAVDDSGQLAHSILGQDAFCNLARITIQKNSLEMMHDQPTAQGCPKDHA